MRKKSHAQKVAAAETRKVLRRLILQTLAGAYIKDSDDYGPDLSRERRRKLAMLQQLLGEVK